MGRRRGRGKAADQRSKNAGTETDQSQPCVLFTPTRRVLGLENSTRATALTSGSLLMAAMHFESFMPARCWMAPEMLLRKRGLQEGPRDDKTVVEFSMAMTETCLPWSPRSKNLPLTPLPRRATAPRSSRSDRLGASCLRTQRRRQLSRRRWRPRGRLRVG